MTQGKRLLMWCCGKDLSSWLPGANPGSVQLIGFLHWVMHCCPLHPAQRAPHRPVLSTRRYALYSSATMLVATLGGGSAAGFTLDTTVGEFVATHPDLRIPPRGALAKLYVYNLNFTLTREAWPDGDDEGKKQSCHTHSHCY